MKRTWCIVILCIIATLLFAVAYSQSPLLTSNQYQYFLHGLAHAGVGFLSEDWLANTSDPTPLFSGLVEITARVNAMGIVHFYYILVMGVYLISITGIVVSVFPELKSGRNIIFFLGGMIFMHSAGLRYILSQSLGAEWAYIFEGGVAGQRLLGPVFQPSVFGVFLLLSLYLFIKKWHMLAVLSAILAASFHPTYLMSAAVLTAVYISLLIFRDKEWRKSLWLAIIALVAVSPILIYTLTGFMGGTPDITNKAHDILVNIRIPHHARIEDWFNATVLIQLIILVVSLYVTHKKQIFPLQLFPLGFCILLTIAQYFSGNLTLALLFPWRISTWLIPVASGLILAKGALWFSNITSKTRKRILGSVGISFLLLAISSGVVRTYVEVLQMSASPARPIQQYVAEHRQPEEVYLIPVKMYDFRLNAGVAVYDDFFSIPYRSDDVIEWYDRFLQGKYFYDLADCNRISEFSRAGVTHVIIPVGFSKICTQFDLEYLDDAFGLYKLNLE